MTFPNAEQLRTELEAVITDPVRNEFIRKAALREPWIYDQRFDISRPAVQYDIDQLENAVGAHAVMLNTIRQLTDWTDIQSDPDYENPDTKIAAYQGLLNHIRALIDDRRQRQQQWLMNNPNPYHDYVAQ